MLASTIAVLLVGPMADALGAQRGGGGEPPGLPMPSVRNLLITEALEELEAQGFTDVEIARVWMTDMPPVVLEQIPEPSVQTDQGFTPLYPPPTSVWLVVVEAFPRLPDLTGWRADRALALVEALSSDITANVDAPEADLSQSTVVGQDPPPGLVDPAGTVLLEIGLFPPRPVPDLPDLTGWRADRALAFARALSPTIVASLDDALADPRTMVVVSQSPPPGSVEANSTVELQVERIPFPDAPPTIAPPIEGVPLGTVAIVTLAGFMLGGIGAMLAFRPPGSTPKPRVPSSSSSTDSKTSEAPKP